MKGEATLYARLFSRRGAVLLARNTVVSTFVFLLGLALLWLLVERLGVAKVPAAGLSFLVSNSIHYVFGRTWIYRGTDRKVAAGYAFFLINAVLGLGVTVGLFAAFIELGLHYLLARVVASIFAGLALFLLNAVLNFRSL
ncbi:MAG TPA: GtrA family protein [Sphingomicrobium sp.]|nr:GtrA family protein [Sphingomicrobium sp.]